MLNFRVKADTLVGVDFIEEEEGREEFSNGIIKSIMKQGNGCLYFCKEHHANITATES